MQELVEIVCDSLEKVDFAKAYCHENGYSNIRVSAYMQYTVVTIEGTSPYEFNEIGLPTNENVWVVTAEK